MLASYNITFRIILSKLKKKLALKAAKLGGLLKKKLIN